jgi:hypothetical protein
VFAVGGLLLMVVGVWVLVQVTYGEALKRLGLLNG